MTVSNSVRRLAVLASAVTAAFTAPAFAAENGQVRALLGAPSYELATPQFPGIYGQLWYQHYSADKVRDNNGDEVSRSVTVPNVGVVPVKVDTKVRADVIVPRVTWITEQLIAEGRLGFSASLPLVKQRTTVGLSSAVPALQPTLNANAARMSGEESGVADMEVAGFVDWQQESSRLAGGLAVVAPTGDYEAGRAVNIGTGKYWTVRPLLVASHVWDNGFQIGTRTTYSVNSTNRDTGVKSGQYIHADWAAVYPLGDLWRVGVQGFALVQTTKDKDGGITPDGNKVQTYGAGPTIAYLSESGTWALDFKVMQEFAVRNRPEGTIGWLRLNFRVD
ncbi:MAG: transporter [Rhizobacter sp.]